ncbi:MAG: sugar phosphate isomerase/epimerase family protein [Chitinophagales bacterium]
MKKLIFCSLLSLCSLFFFTQCNSQPKQGDEEQSKKDSQARETTKATDNTKNWKIGVQMWTFRVFSLEEALSKADSAGIKNVECFFGQNLFVGSKDKFGSNMSAENRAKLKQMLNAKGIQIVAMGVITPKNREEWTKAFDLAKEFGLSYITCEPIKNQWDMIDSMAGNYGIKLAIHDHPRPNAYWHPDSVLAASKGHPNIGSCADVGHWARNGLDPVECLKKLEGHVFGVHLKDIVKFNNTMAEDTIVGKGVIDFPAIFRELNRQGFSGMLSIEHESNWQHNLPDVIETVKYYNQEVAKLK